ncbi:TPA_asm: hypothetical protein HUJ06_031897 [Nelumbo nucifera]|uniref:Uncharacterized protein n=1 Tax=Nelumbo nucifera TaxID=4432 RepID=A0A822YF93_NELNU|nr:TPA_asm: hypothetical protein HUJ06_011547 [Nelumbo nucifera]DAD32836.1 TPA_asm: hypothetical protein HUJ06_011687 [Nelumbo nucifera]DAD32844.1 TPA_asm: hypothetical protein HUJ06_011695 [Nelumbo nucifera]DAD37191.1 TPA_asm: hypothetical protein HUJ06_007832 [Nelumbo nucifera]DAD49462.1 TPA_asm: hypothetical protein HUJ06_031806 [Nelumbo nucifera]
MNMSMSISLISITIDRKEKTTKTK